MSWQTYVDDHLMCDIDGHTLTLTAAAIIGHDGAVWAQSSNFPQVHVPIPILCMHIWYDDIYEKFAHIMYI